MKTFLGIKTYPILFFNNKGLCVTSKVVGKAY